MNVEIINVSRQEKSKRPRYQCHNNYTRLTILVMLVVLAGCNLDFVNLTASLGGSSAGQRGVVRVVVINNTPHRAVMTFGTFDPANQDAPASFDQLGLDDSGLILEGGEVSSVRAVLCGRVFSVGGADLLQRISDTTDVADVDTQALVDGVAFFEVSAGTTTTMNPMPVGQASAMELLIGREFACESLLMLRLEINDPGPQPFRIDYDLIVSGSTRP